MSNIKVVQYGCGKMSKYTMLYAYSHGFDVVGAFDISDKVIGLDIGDIMDTDKKGIIVDDISNVEERLLLLKPDVVIVTTMSLLSDVKNILLLCAKLGINAITTCEEAFYPENSSPTLTKQIDDLAKKNNCTISGTGYQDAYWGNLVTTIGGSLDEITKIKGSSSYNVEDYGLALAKAHGAGLSLDEFEKDIAELDNISDEERKKIINEGSFLPSYMWNVNGWLCDKLNLHVINQTQKCIPTTDDYDLVSSTLNMTVKSGMVTGMRAVVTTLTKENIILENECIGKIYNKDEFDKNDWQVIGEPSTELVINRPDTVKLTCATIINRIPDLISAQSGFVPTSRMGELNNYKYIIKKNK